VKLHLEKRNGPKREDFWKKKSMHGKRERGKKKIIVPEGVSNAKLCDVGR